DQAPQMLAVARERMQAADLQNVELVEGDAETVALPPNPFDAVVCRWGLMLFLDPVAMLARLRTSLVPAGHLVAAVWGAPERAPIIALPFPVLSGALGQPPAPLRGPNPFALSEPARLERVAHDAGFAEVHSEPWTVTLTFASVDELLDHVRDTSASL